MFKKLGPIGATVAILVTLALTISANQILGLTPLSAFLRYALDAALFALCLKCSAVGVNLFAEAGDSALIHFDAHFDERDRPMFITGIKLALGCALIAAVAAGGITGLLLAFTNLSGLLVAFVVLVFSATTLCASALVLSIQFNVHVGVLHEGIWSSVLSGVRRALLSELSPAK